MNAKVQVAGHPAGWHTLAVILGFAVLLLGLLLASWNRLAGTCCAALGGLVIAAGGLAIIKRRKGRVWIENKPGGFTLTDAHGSRDFVDEQLISANLQLKKNYAEGLITSTRRTFCIKLEGEPDEVRIVNLISTGASDPLAQLIQRLIQLYRQRAAEAIGEGARVTGKGWAYDVKGLKLLKQSPESTASNTQWSVSHLVAVAQFDDCVCVWARGQNDAVLRAPIHSENAFLLQLLLDDAIDGQGEQDPGAVAPDSEQGLGRIMFERKGSTAVLILLGIAALTLLVVGWGALTLPHWAFKTIGVAALVAAAVCVWLVARFRSATFRCHEHGVYRRGPFHAGQLRYAEVEQFSHTATRQYYKGIYTGTTVALLFVPDKESGKRPIGFQQNVRQVDEALEVLRDHVSQIIAERMMKRYSAGEDVNWTPGLTLRQNGLEHRKQGLLGRKGPYFVPLENIYGYDLEQGVFYVWEHNQKKSTISEPAGEPNFFPGFEVFNTIMQRAGGDAPTQNGA